VLTAIGYQAGAEITMATKVSIVNGYVYAPLVAAIVALVAMLFYNLNKKKLEEMQMDIDTRAAS
jgi:Na+/melibiose symporter-like transporter